MTVALYRTSQHEFDPKDHDAFIKTLQADFELTYKRKSGEDFTVTAPETYQIKTLSGMLWVYEADTIRNEKYKHRKHPYKINVTYTLSQLKDNIVRFLLCSAPQGLSNLLISKISNVVDAIDRIDLFQENKSELTGTN